MKMKQLPKKPKSFEECLQEEAVLYLGRIFKMDSKTIKEHVNNIEASSGKSSALLKSLLAALKAERRKARIKHWSYSLSRHIALRQALEEALINAAL